MTEAHEDGSTVGAASNGEPASVGDASNFKPSVASLKMSDDTVVPVPHGGVVVFVGPNNAGKSVSLNDIVQHLTRQHTPPLAVKEIEVRKTGSEPDLVAWLEKYCTKGFTNGQDAYSRNGSSMMQRSLLLGSWRRGHPYSALGDMLVFFAVGASRLDGVMPVESVNYTTYVEPNTPLQYLYMDPDLEQKVSDLFVRAFDEPLVLHRHAGSMLHLHVGEAPPAPPVGTPPPRGYIDALNALPRLDVQGDGMKSFMGLMLNIVTSSFPFVFVDEPEAFLHPPQARLLGRLLGSEKGADDQVFVSTHDSDVLTGLLDSPADTTIVRLVRDGDVNRASPLDSEKVKALWNDPLLRYSNVLDGLFHEAVILCEGDSDCRFYNAVLDALEEEEGGDEVRRQQLLFTHCGGKHRMPTVIAALRAVSVPVRAIADFDVLREKDLLHKIVSNLGGDWEAIEPHHSIVSNALDRLTRGPTTEYVREHIEKVLASITTSHLTKDDVEEIRKYTKSDSGWDRAKRDGKHAVPRGDASGRLEELLLALSQIGLYVVPVGEMEAFAPQIGGNKSRWVNAVLERGLHKYGSLTEARTFVRSFAEGGTI